MPKLICFFFTIVLLNTQFICAAQDNNIIHNNYKRCQVKTINFEQGLMNNETGSMVTDRLGFTWISTKTGIQRFNGYVLENINPVIDHDTIAIDYSVIFFPLKNGNVWISYQHGILEYDPFNNNFRKIISLNGYPKGFLPVIPLLQKTGETWCIYAGKGIVVYNNGTISQPLGNAGSTFVDTVLQASPFLYTRYSANNGEDIFLSNSRQLLHINTAIPKINYLQYDFINIFGLECRKKNLYVAMGTGFVSIDINNSSINKTIPYKEFVGEESVFSAQVYLTGEDQLLVSVNRHLYEFDKALNYQKEFTLLTGDPVIATGTINIIYTDRFKRIWLMTNDDIKLIQNTEVPFTHYIYHSAKNNFVKCIYYDDQKHLLLVGCFNGGIQLYDTSGNPLWSKPLVNDSANDIMIVEKLTADDFLIETYYRGWFILNLPSKTIKRFSIPAAVENVLHSNAVGWTNNIQRLSDSVILISTKNNIYHCVFKNNSIQSARPLFPFLTNIKEQFDCFIYTSRKSLWAGTNGGSIFILDSNQNIKHVDIPGNFGARSCCEDAMHNVWMGADKGLYVYNSSAQLIRKLTTESGLLNDCIYALLPVDKQQAVFASSNLGLAYVSVDGTIKHYTKELGLQENEFNNGAACKTPGGKFYFGGVNGITGFYPASLSAIKDTPQLNVTRLVVNDSVYNNSGVSWNGDSILLSYDQNHIQLDIAANGLLNAEEYIYTYRLKSLEESWQTTREPRAIRYTLDPGTYLFEIKCSPYLSSDLVFSKKIVIIISPPWWQTWWFRLLVAVLLAVLIALIVWQYSRWRYQKKIRALHLQHEIQQERERISRDLHDNLGAYVAAIVANVNRIREPDKNVSSLAINELENNSQSIVSQLQDTIWALNREAIALTAISDRFKIFLQKIRPTYPGIDISVRESISNDATVSPANALHLFRIMQEAVNNAVRHSQCNTVTVLIESNSNWVISIIDDGAGMQVSTNPGSGNGLRNMRQRAKEAGWEIEWMEEKPKGTRLRITSAS